MRTGAPRCQSDKAFGSCCRVALEDDDLLDLALADPVRHDDRAEAAASVLGPKAVGRLVDAFLDVGSRVRVDGKYDSAASDTYTGLLTRIAHVPGALRVTRSEQAVAPIFDEALNGRQ